jgi:hypothetical protein
MRSWSTFKQPNNWNSLQNKPTILADNLISWGEIQGKPTGKVQAVVSFGDGLESINFMADSGSGTNGSKAGISFFSTFSNYPNDRFKRRSADIWSGFDSIWGSEFLAFGVGKSGIPNDLMRVTDEKMRLSWDGTLTASRIKLTSIPTDIIGLTTGTFYRDINGFVKVVI